MIYDSTICDCNFSSFVDRSHRTYLCSIEKVSFVLEHSPNNLARLRVQLEKDFFNPKSGQIYRQIFVENIGSINTGEKKNSPSFTRSLYFYFSIFSWITLRFFFGTHATRQKCRIVEILFCMKLIQIFPERDLSLRKILSSILNTNSPLEYIRIFFSIYSTAQYFS